VTKQGEPARFARKTDLNDITESYKRFMMKDTLQDFATHVLQVSDTTYNERFLSRYVTWICFDNYK
jgi:hypothetical protein